MSQSVWILTDGKKGTENQCIGLADALNLKTSIKRVSPKFPWSILPPCLWFSPLKGIEGLDEKEKWPDILIAAGRSAAPVAKEIRRKSDGKTFTIFLQNPYISPKHFDFVIAPKHDGLEAPNVVSTLGALHGVTHNSLKESYKKHSRLLKNLSSKKVAVLIGGKTRHFQMDEPTMETYGLQLRNLSKRQPVGYMVTASRRTDEKCLKAFQTGLGAAPKFLWDGKGDNPYQGFLSHADIIMVTADSVSMISEALSTGKPVYLLRLKGNSKRLGSFHNELLEKGYARFFKGTLEHWDYAPIDNMGPIFKKLDALGFKS